MTFEDLFKEIQELLHQLKPEHFTHFFQNKLYYSALLNWLILKMKNNQWQITLDKTSGLAKSPFLFYSTAVSKNILTNSLFLFLGIKKEIFCPFQDFQGPRPKFKDFPGPENFFPPIPGLSRIFKDRGNLVHL